MDTFSAPAASRWGSLTYELGRAASPVAAFFKQRYPNIKPVQQRYRDSVGAIILGGAGAPSGTLGTAFDWAIRFMLHPQPSPRLALVSVRRRFPPLAAAAADLITCLGVAVDESGRPGVDTFEGPATGSGIPRDLMLRGCWALALLTEVYRVGGIHPQSALAQLDRARISVDDLLAIAPPAALHELGQLLDLASTALLPNLADRRGSWALGPTFDGSVLMNADADFIAAGLLVELKTNLGDKRTDGTRRAGLDGPTLYQVIGYALLDFTNQFAVDAVALYSARYGHLAVWPLSLLLRDLAGREVDLAAEREALRAVLQPQST